MATTRTRKKTDPFAVDTATNTNNEEITVDVQPTENTETGELEWSATFKFGSGFDAPWLVGRFANLDAVNDTLTNRADLLRDTMEKVGRAGLFAASQTPSGGSGNTGGGGNTQAARPARQQAPGGQSRQCQHGDMVYRSGSKNGRTWEAFFCPTPQGTADQCKPQFI